MRRMWAVTLLLVLIPVLALSDNPEWCVQCGGDDCYVYDHGAQIEQDAQMIYDTTEQRLLDAKADYAELEEIEEYVDSAYEDCRAEHDHLTLIDEQEIDALWDTFHAAKHHAYLAHMGPGQDNCGLWIAHCDFYLWNIDGSGAYEELQAILEATSAGRYCNAKNWTYDWQDYLGLAMCTFDVNNNLDWYDATAPDAWDVLEQIDTYLSNCCDEYSTRF